MEPKVREEVRRDLVSSLGEHKVLSDRADLMPYTADTHIGVIRRGDDMRHFPDFVVMPESTQEVQAVVKVAARHRVPVLPKGGGSNRTGMLLPVSGGIVVDTIRMKRVVEVSGPNLFVTVQPGITLKELEEALAGYGLALNQEQGSFKVATVGGSISTSGFGRKHQKYGSISDRVMSLEVVLADGSVLRTSPKVLYTSTGYRLNQLFIGAEGTLGVITEATLRVEPLPEAKGLVMGFFKDFWAALEAAKSTMASSVTFVGGEACELDDAAAWGGPAGINGMFYVSLEGTKGEVEAEGRFVTRMIEAAGGVIASPEASGRLFGKYTIQWCGARAVTGYEDDFLPYVPVDRIREFYDKVWGDIMPRHGIEPTEDGRYSVDIGRYRMVYGKFCIAPGVQGWKDYSEAYHEIVALAVSLGGSIAGCTGIGLKHIDDLGLECSDTALEVMWAIKHALDPDNIMNPGKKLPPLDRS